MKKQLLVTLLLLVTAPACELVTPEVGSAEPADTSILAHELQEAVSRSTFVIGCQPGYEESQGRCLKDGRYSDGGHANGVVYTAPSVVGTSSEAYLMAHEVGHVLFDMHATCFAPTLTEFRSLLESNNWLDNWTAKDYLSNDQKVEELWVDLLTHVIQGPDYSQLEYFKLKNPHGGSISFTQTLVPLATTAASCL